MANILYLHPGKGQPAFYVRVNNGPDGVKAIHGTLQLGRVVNTAATRHAAIRATGYSPKWLKDAGYEPVCSLGEDEAVLNSFLNGYTQLPAAVSKAILGWWRLKQAGTAQTGDAEGQTTEADLIEEPEPETKVNPWEW